MSLVTVDSLLLAEVNSLAETRALELLDELNAARNNLAASDTQVNRNRYAQALATHTEAVRAVRAVDALLYPQTVVSKPTARNVVPFIHPASEPAVESLVTVLDPTCPCGEPLPAYMAPQVDHKGRQICFGCEERQLAYRDGRAANDAAGCLVGPDSGVSRS